MHDMTELKDVLERELKNLAKDDKMTIGSLDKIHKLTDTIKNLDKISLLEESGEYSQRDRNYNIYGTYDGSYEGNSYARRRRDSMGRYTRDGRGRSNRDDYARDGYSRGGKDEMIMKIEDMMGDVSSEKERLALEKCLSALENS